MQVGDLVTIVRPKLFSQRFHAGEIGVVTKVWEMNGEAFLELAYPQNYHVAVNAAHCEKVERDK